jgi:OOP family OmpA-OmpF porin
MKRNIILSVAAIAATVTMSYAGGDIVPVYEPVVAPEAIQYDSVPVYVGLGLNRGVYNHSKCSNCDYEDVTYGITLRAGYDINEYVGIEARYIGTFWDADELGGQELTHVGLYVKPMMAINEQLNIYGLVGYGLTTTSTGGNGNLAEVDDNGFAAGIGMEYDIDTEDAEGSLESGFGLFVDYQRLLIKSDVPDMDVLSAGVTFDF